MRTILTISTYLALVLFLVNANATDMWPRGAELAYIDRCAESLSSQGLPLKKARGHCTCTTNGMEDEFGMKEYEQMMGAEANPNGSEYDRRLYDVLVACKEYLPNYDE